MYESDIVNYKGRTYVILWNQFVCSYNFYGVTKNKLQSDGPIWYSFEKEIERIGNILENPEILQPFSVQLIYYYNNTGRLEGQLG